ncbi:MAG TPA: hypothetical protein VG652_03720 [Gaiellaceae bacterium]|nr:hypothetical protein [Gaiellaceae bacterium]
MTPLGKALSFAASASGRKALKQAVQVARSGEGKKLIAQAHKVATSPEGRKLIEHARKAASEASSAAKSPANRDRVEAIRAALAKRKAS